MHSHRCEYANRMRAYMDSLESTRTVVVYFRSDGIPHIQEELRIMHAGGMRFLVHCGYRSNLVHIYGPSDLTTHAFDIGSHFTAGVMFRKGVYMLFWYFTECDEERTMFIESPYWIRLDDREGLKTWQHNGITLPESYAEGVPEAIEKIRGVFAGEISVNGGESPSPLLDPGIIDLIYTHIVSPACQANKDVGCRMNIDLGEEHPVICLRYEADDHNACRIIYLSAKTVFKAYDYVRRQQGSTQDAQECFDELRSIAEIHAAAIVDM